MYAFRLEERHNVSHVSFNVPKAVPTESQPNSVVDNNKIVEKQNEKTTKFVEPVTIATGFLN